MCCSDLALAYVEAHASWNASNTRPTLDHDYSAFITRAPSGEARLDLAVEGVRCAACMNAIEREIGGLAGVASARLNFSDRRLTVRWRSFADATPGDVLRRLEDLGFRGSPFAPGRGLLNDDLEYRRILRCLGVAGIASMNVMILAVSVWAGLVSDMTQETRDFFHWLQALIALPAAAYAGRPFYESAYAGLRAGRVNMDVPITLGVVLTLIMSVVETALHAEHAYFDGATMLLFLLLVGRALDHAMRRRARVFAENLSALRGERASRILPDGAIEDVPVQRVAPGDLVLIRPGDRAPADGVVEAGASEIDQSLLTGETAAVKVGAGDMIYAGSLNGAGALTVRVRAAADATLLEEINGLVGRALAQKSATALLADQAVRAYVPFVHGAALATLLGWLALGGGWHAAILNAVAVLIITCPCALGLAIPTAQVAAAGALFREGVLLNSGDALERFGDIDTVAFDKTGVLTLPEPTLIGGAADPSLLALAARLAASSRHPMAAALRSATMRAEPIPGAEERAGLGVRAWLDGVELRLGSPAFCGAEGAAAAALARHPEASAICFRRGDAEPVAFPVTQTPRADARETIEAIRALGMEVLILSGDRASAVEAVARELGVARWAAQQTPADKIAAIETLRRQGRKVMMVGDGINDAPALAAANVSASPVTAAHVSQAAADALFIGRTLRPVAELLRIGRKASRLMRENLWIAAAYNIAAVPLAAAGFLTPLIAAAAMSLSSLVVTANALRAHAGARMAPLNDRSGTRDMAGEA